MIWAVSVRAPAHNYLSPEEAKRYYDRLGSAQDWQCFYENPAVTELIAHVGLESVHSVFEFGSGRYVHPQRKDERGEHDESSCFVQFSGTHFMSPRGELTFQF